MFAVVRRVTANVCPDIDYLLHADLNTMSSVEGTQVLVTCGAGYEYRRGVTVKLITCQPNLQWSDTDLECTGHCPHYSALLLKA